MWYQSGRHEPRNEVAELPIYCFVAVAFWNLVGAGLFGFFINPPIALYYMRALRPGAAWRNGPLAVAFWCINGGLALMALLSLLPLGLLQASASVEVGTWWARSSEFMHRPVMDGLRWTRIPGDTLFAIGALALGWFVLGLRTGWSLERRAGTVAPGSTEVRVTGERGNGRRRRVREGGSAQEGGAPNLRRGTRPSVPHS